MEEHEMNQDTAALATHPATSQEGDSVRRDDIRRSIIRQLGDDPHADRIILNSTDWDIVLEALRAPIAATPTPPTLSEDLRGLVEAADEAWEGLKQTQLAASEVGVEIAQSVREGYGLNLTLAIRAALAQGQAS